MCVRVHCCGCRPACLIYLHGVVVLLCVHVRAHIALSAFLVCCCHSPVCVDCMCAPSTCHVFVCLHARVHPYSLGWVVRLCCSARGGWLHLGGLYTLLAACSCGAVCHCAPLWPLRVTMVPSFWVRLCSCLSGASAVLIPLPCTSPL